MPWAAASEAFVALGLLSAAKTGVKRRAKIRAVSASFPNWNVAVALRFVVAIRTNRTRHENATLAEARSARDLVLMNMSESPFRCGFKYLLWMEHACQAFPAAQYIGAGDDDAYIQLSHFEADLRNVWHQTAD